METAAGTPEANTAFSGRTAWVRNLETPLRTFLRTETGSAAVLLAGVIAALVWANVDMASYAHVWEDDAVEPHRRRGSLAQPSLLGELGSDDAVLLRHRPRGAARVRPRRAARATAGDASGCRGRGRDGDPRWNLPRAQRRTLVGARLGSGDVDRHRICARAARAPR